MLERGSARHGDGFGQFYTIMHRSTKVKHFVCCVLTSWNGPKGNVHTLNTYYSVASSFPDTLLTSSFSPGLYESMDRVEHGGRSLGRMRCKVVDFSHISLRLYGPSTIRYMHIVRNCALSRECNARGVVMPAHVPRKFRLYPVSATLTHTR